ncbi:lysosomal beta glucosidase-like [Hibiscus syriacus]|uniref:Lysosomal beta glucosidase-like n=1 Tax=Hibiscus syriacus TaxID=106335 RepID=A0A6A2XM24_HIBSY|nr:lysosomal beta glucosidase-like [Hibiscus syriacus]
MVDVSSLSSSTSLYESDTEELQHMPLKPVMKNNRCLSKQLSMCETSRDIHWERRNRILHHERGKNIEEPQRMTAVPSLMKNRRYLSKQLSMLETSRDIAWERRRRQILCQEKKKTGMAERNGITDEDLNELKGCIELGFGFNEEEGQKLCNTLPALDLYFAVNRQLSPSPVSTPHSRRSSSISSLKSSFGSPKSDQDWKICSPGEDPQQVKTKLRHWAQAVACSVMQSS